MHAEELVTFLKERLCGKMWIAATLSAALLLSCSPSGPSEPGQTQGRIQVSVSTSGTGVPASYTVRLDGGSAQSVDADGTATFNALGPGNYEVELAVPSNCSVSGSTTRTVGVQEGSTSSVSFNVTCSAVPTGAIGVTTTTAGSPADPDGYTVSVDGGAGESIEVNGTLLLADLGLGEHQVALGGVAENCLVQGANPRMVSVSEDQTTPTDFQVVCSATTGLIEVTVTTTGQGQDPDGYEVTLDDVASQPISASGTITFQGVEEGPHTLTLAGVATNCSITSGNPVTADVVAGQTAEASFAVECAATSGAIEVTVSTSGEQIDADGYTVVLDGGPQSQPVATNGATTFATVEPGNHSLQLGNVAGNCTVTSPNPATASVSAGTTTDVAFTVQCEELTGNIQVNVSTSGSNQDSDGYTVSVDGGSGQSIGVNGSRTFSNVVIGDHAVEIAGVAGNCGVQGNNPRTATVTEGATAQVNFVVECSATSGQIQVTVTTTGEDLDPDGYSVDLDGTSSRTVVTNGSTTFTGVSTGGHQLTLQNIADNCTVTSANPTSTTVVAGTTANVSFDVECEGLTGDLRVTTDTDGDELDPNGYDVVIDGGAVTRSIASNGTEVFQDLDDGNHTVELDEASVASNCTVDGENPRTVNVPVDGQVSTTFDVTCEATVGSIQVDVSTSGEDEDPNGYEVTLDGGSRRSVGVGGSTTYDNLAPGSHTVELDEATVAANCTVTSTNPTTENVTAGNTTPVSFTVDCEGLTGDLEVTTQTGGDEPDPNGYEVVIDGGAVTRSIANTDTELFQDLADGSHSVELTGVATNCTVSDDNPRIVTVPANGTETTTFQVTCGATTGSIQLGVSTSGDDPDLDGYTVTLDGGAPQSLDPDDTYIYMDLAPDTYDIELTEHESNCTVAEENPQEIGVTAGNTSDATFTVTCEELIGDLLVATSTTGEDLDPDGFTILLVGGSSQHADPNGVVTFSDLSPGSQTVELDETTVAGNCTVTSPNPAMVDVVAGEVRDTTFAVSCSLTTGFIEVTTASTGPPDPDGYLVSLDGGDADFLDDVNPFVFSGVSEGPHSVLLSGMDGSCSTTSTNPAMPEVAAGDTTTVDYAVTCT